MPRTRVFPVEHSAEPEGLAADLSPVDGSRYTATMPLCEPLEPAWAWGRRLLGAQVRSLAFLRAALGALALVLAGRTFDLFAFSPDPARASLLGLQTGAFVGMLWGIGTPSALGAYRDPDDGWSSSLRSSRAGSGGLWWGAWAAQWGAAGLLVVLSLLYTTVFSILSGLPTAAPVAALLSAWVAVLVPGLMASAVAAWSGGVFGALAGFVSFALGHVGTLGPLRALGPPPVAATLDGTALLRAAALAVAAIAVTTAGLRRLRL